MPRQRTYLVSVEFAVGTDIEETAGGVIGTSTKSVPVGEELDGVDVGLVSSKSLDGLTSPDIPQFGESITGARDEDVLVGRVDADGHDVAQVVGELGHLRAGLDIPQHTGHVTGRGKDTAIVDETAAGQVTRVSRQLARDTGRPLAGRQVVDRANVIQTATGDIVSTRGVGASHHPRRPQWDRVNFVGGVGVPDNELSILRGGNEVTAVSRPVHGVNLGQMALECPAWLHPDPGQSLGLVLCNLTDCTDERNASQYLNSILYCSERERRQVGVCWC